MNKTIIVTLLCMVAVVVLFTATSCKNKIFGGPDIPQQAGVIFLDTGYGWKSESEVPWETGWWMGINNFGFGPSPDSQEPVDCNYKSVYESEGKMPLKGSHIRIAYRFTDEDKRSGGFFSPGEDAHLIPLWSFSKSGAPQVRPCDVKDKLLPTVNKSDTAGDKSLGIVYLEFELPPSPVGVYQLFYSGNAVWLVKDLSATGGVPAKIPPPEVTPPVPVGELICNVFYTNVKNVTRAETRWTHHTDAAIGDRVSFYIYMELANTSTDQTLIAHLTNQLGENLRYIDQSSYIRINNSGQQLMLDKWITEGLYPKIDPQHTVPVEITFDAWVVVDPSNHLWVTSASATLQGVKSTATDAANINLEIVR